MYALIILSCLNGYCASTVASYHKTIESCSKELRSSIHIYSYKGTKYRLPMTCINTKLRLIK